MMEDCATSMSAPHGCNDNMAVVETFKEALIERVGEDRYRMWFSHGVMIAPGSADGEQSSTPQPMTAIILTVRGQFALDRLRQNFLREMRGAAMQASGARMEVVLRLDEPVPTQAELPLVDEQANSDLDRSEKAVPIASGQGNVAPKNPSDAEIQDAVGKRSKLNSGDFVTRGRNQRKFKSNSRRTKSISALIADSKRATEQQRQVRIDQAEQLEFPGLQHPGSVATGGSHLPLPAAGHLATKSLATGSTLGTKPARTDKSQSKSTTPKDSRHQLTAANFVAGTSNQLAYTAMSMVCQDPRTASPIFFCGPTGTGKTHLMSAIAEQLRRRHRLRRVMHLSAEQFTNDFISSVGNSGITAFRRRYREVDALLIDDVQFLGAKKATLREMLYTVETLAAEGRPLLFSGLQAPTEIPGLSRELAGRMASGLVCPIQPLDASIRKVILDRWLEQRCPLQVPTALVDQINPMLAGDGRVVSGVVNMVNTLQRMFGRVPSLDEIRQFGGNLLRSTAPIATLSVIETAVCDAFHLPHSSLRGRSQTRAVTGPRMLAMYLARQLTSSAYSEIATHFGGKSHSTAISAENNVKTWLKDGKSIGRGQIAMSTQEAINRVENLLRSG